MAKSKNGRVLTPKNPSFDFWLSFRFFFFLGNPAKDSKTVLRNSGFARAHRKKPLFMRTVLPTFLRYQPPFRTVRARIAVALVVFIKTPINHIFFKSLIIPDFGFELTKTIYLNVFRNWSALCKSTCLYKSCSIPAGNKRKKTINTAFASQHVPLKNRVSDF